MKRPNILYIHSHDTGRYVQPYGHAIPTPNIQRLAEEGVLFRKAFCAAPTCSPSRACLLTGQSAHSNGMLGLAHRGFALKDYKHHIIRTLRSARYQSVLCGVQHIARDPSVIGYHRIIEVPDNRAENVAPAAAEFLKSGPKEPFFLSVGFTETHRRFRDRSPAEDARYCMPPAPIPDTPGTRADMAAFKASARILDEGMGRVFDALRESGLDKNTLVICTTDHGIAFPGMKCNLTDHGLGVMLIIRGPGGFAGGKVVNGMVSHTDVFPTLCDLLEIKPPDWLEGTSFMPLVRGRKKEVNDEIFGEITFHAAFEPQRCVRTRRWKYIRHFDDRNMSVLPNCDDSPSKEVWMKHRWHRRAVPVERLYDLVFDPNETDDLAGNSSAGDVLLDMWERLERWMTRTNDPVLPGPVLPPEGARLNDPDGLSPGEPAALVE